MTWTKPGITTTIHRHFLGLQMLTRQKSLKQETLNWCKTLAIAMTHCYQKFNSAPIKKAIWARLYYRETRRNNQKALVWKTKRPKPKRKARTIPSTKQLWHATYQLRIMGENHHAAKQLNIRASTNLSHLADAGVILAKSTDKLLSLYDKKDSNYECRELITLNLCTLALLGHASYEVSQRRRETLKPHLKKEFLFPSVWRIPTGLTNKHTSY